MAASLLLRASSVRAYSLLTAVSLGLVSGTLHPSSPHRHPHLHLSRSLCSSPSADAVSAADATVASAGKDGGDNPLLKAGRLPSFVAIRPAHVLPAINANLDQLKKGLAAKEKQLSSPAPATQDAYRSAVEDLERLQAPLDFSWGVVKHLMAVKNSDELRAAHDAVQSSVVQTLQLLGQSKPLYDALVRIRSDAAAWSALAEPQQRIIASAIRDMKASGIALDAARRERFNALQLELAELSSKFSNNVLDATKAYHMLLTKKEEVAGLPPSALALAAQQAAQLGHAGASAESGPWLITLDMPSYLGAMKYLDSRELRKQLYMAFISRASQGSANNTAIISRILTLRQEVARMLDFGCYADLSLSSKMAPSYDGVMSLLEMLRAKSLPAAQQDLKDLKEFARSQRPRSGGVQPGADKKSQTSKKGQEEDADELQLWDVPYWSTKLRESRYEYEEEALRPYFPLPSVLSGMFRLAHRLFGLIVEPADGQAEVWHPDVRYFKIKEEATGQYVASFFLDPYSRSAEKRGGAWMDVCLGRSKVLNQLPVAYLVCNGSPPVGDEPSLMTFREVETLFHEFGHGLQHMATRVVHGDAAGIRNIEWDAVELPSQFMENWCYDEPTLYSFARHHQTGAPLPKELFEKVKASKNFQAGLMMMRQLFFGALDMRLHSALYDPAAGSAGTTAAKTSGGGASKQTVTPFDIQKEVAERFSVMPPLDEDRFLCSFSHIFAGGYSAGYYSYKWAEVMSADAFAAFEEAGLGDEQAVKSTGRRFRETVLAMGGGKHPGEVFRAFRGRDPSPEALLRHNGLTK